MRAADAEAERLGHGRAIEGVQGRLPQLEVRDERARLGVEAQGEIDVAGLGDVAVDQVGDGLDAGHVLGLDPVGEVQGPRAQLQDADGRVGDHAEDRTSIR